MTRPIVVTAAALARFRTKYRVTETGCWEWTAARHPNGYGAFSAVDGRNVYAHRFAYTALVGPIPDGLDIDHLCRNRACVNPAHMEPVSRQVNLLRGRTIARKHAAKIHCVHGHPFDTANTLRRGPGGRWRDCRRCRRERTAA